MPEPETMLALVDRSRKHAADKMFMIWACFDGRYCLEGAGWSAAFEDEMEIMIR